VEAKVVDHDFEELDPVPEGSVDDDTELDEVVGEIVVHGPNVMEEYYERPEANGEAFTGRAGKRWFHTGDLGYYDVDGFVYIVDREKHRIVTGGYDVYPREVEELLFEHPAVADAAVVGVPDERRGETVTAFVVKQPGADVTAEEIKRYCFENLAEYKHPREVEFVEELPRTTTGKVQKFELQDFE
jgi:long-chain acyl-CoA synthetase